MRIILADDHVLVLDALQAYLKVLQPGIEVLRAIDFDQAIELASRSADVDLVVLDFNMPGMGGLEGLRVMQRRHPDLPVVLLSGYATSELVREALNLGAAGFIPKDLAGPAMIKALELVLSGETYVPAMALSADGDRQDATGAGRFAPGNPLSGLTSRELDVLRRVIQGETNKAIARELGLKAVTVAFHLKNVFRKLRVSTRTEAATRAIELGLSR
jgi:DNA-binding NarL/FixJ family response regulator